MLPLARSARSAATKCGTYNHLRVVKLLHKLQTIGNKLTKSSLLTSQGVFGLLQQHDEIYFSPDNVSPLLPLSFFIN